MQITRHITKFRASLGIRSKLTGVVGLGFLAILSVIFSLTIRNQNNIAEDVQRSEARIVANLLADRIAGPTQFRDRERLQKVLEPITDEDNSILTVDVYHESGEVLVQYSARGTRSDALLQRLEAARAAALQPAERSLDMGNGYMLMAVPIISAGSAKRTGLMILSWDSAHVAAQLMAKTKSTIMWGITVSIIGLIAIVTLIGRMISQPIRSLSLGMSRIAQQDFATQIPYTNRGDEIGDMAQTLTLFRDALAEETVQRKLREAEVSQRQNLFKRLADGLSDLAKGQVDSHIDISEFESLDVDHQKVCQNFNAVLDNLREILTTITATAESVRNSAAEIADTTVDQSKRSESQAVMLEESAAAIEALSASVDQIAEGAAEASDSINLNRKQAQSGGEVVRLTVDAMKNIEKSSEQITAIIGVIDDIAFQTNLLALNAGVEAARAGEAGRGFAVVASEVRALAQRASESANEIKELILRSGEQVTNGSALANKAGEALNEIITGVNNASDLVSMIATGSREQANNLSEFKESVTELDRVTQQNAAVIEESSAASRSLSDEASRLANVMQRFQLSSTSADTALNEWAEDQDAETLDAANQYAASPDTTVVFSSRARAQRQAVNRSTEWQDF